MRMVHTATPPVALPGFRPQAAQGSQLVGPAGYTADHKAYHSTRQALAKHAYASEAGHVIVAEVRAVHMPVGKTRALLIGVCKHSELW